MLKNGVKNWLEWSELVLKVVTIIGAIFIGWQYFDTKQVEKVKQTTELAKTFHSGYMLNVRLKINRAWNSQRDFLEELSNESVEDDEILEEIKSKIVNSMVEEYSDAFDNQIGLENEIMQIINFYHNVAVMVENRICDKESAQDFFQKFAKDFYTLFEPYIQKRRENISDYAKSLEYVAKGFQS